MQKKVVSLLFILSCIIVSVADFKGVSAATQDGKMQIIENGGASVLPEGVKDATGQSTVFLISDVNLVDLKIISQNNNVFRLNFKIIGNEFSQANMNLAVSLATEYKDNLYRDVDRQIYQEKISVNKVTEISKDIEYVAPEYYSGEYVIRIELLSDSGAVIGSQMTDKIVLNGSNNFVDIDGCKVKIANDTGDKTYALRYGVAINEKESLLLDCQYKNNTKDDLQFIPVFGLKSRSIVGKEIEYKKINYEYQLLKNGETKRFVFEVPKPKDNIPQAYDAEMKIVGTNNEVIFSNQFAVHYVLSGVSAAITNIKFNEKVDVSKNMIVGSAVLVPSADNYPGSRLRSDLPEKYIFTAFISDKNKVKCGDDFNQEIKNTLAQSKVVDYQIKIIDGCVPYFFNAIVFDGNKNKLDETIINLLDFSGEEKKVESDEQGNQQFSKEKDYSVYYLVGGIIIILLLLFFLFFLGKRKIGNIAIIVFVLASGFVLAEKAQAAGGTWGVCTGGCCNRGDCWSVNINTSKNDYNPGENLGVNISVSGEMCNNDVHEFTVFLRNVDNSQQASRGWTLTGSDDFWGNVSSFMGEFTAANSDGSHRMEWWVDAQCGFDADCNRWGWIRIGEGSFYYTTIMPNNNPAYFQILSPSWNSFTCNSNVTLQGRVTDGDNPAPNTQWNFYEGTRGTFGWGGRTLYGSWWVYTSNTFSDGWHRWQGNAYDPKWGWRTDSWDQATFTVDSPPRCQISHVSPGNGWVMPNAGGCVTLQGNVSDPDNRDVQADFYVLRNGGYYWSGYGNYTSGGVSSATICGLPAGDYNWRVHARDGCGKTAGYCGGDGYWWYFRVNRAPTCSITGPGYNQLFRTSDTVNMSVSVSNDNDNGYVAFYPWGYHGSNWGAVGNFSSSYGFRPGSGTFNWSAQVSDTYGALNGCGSSLFRVNSPPSSATANCNPTFRCDNQSVGWANTQLAGSIYDVDGNSNGYVDVQGRGTQSLNSNWNLPSGAYNWQVRAQDSWEPSLPQAYSSWCSLTINTPPSGITQNSPANGAFFCKGSRVDLLANISDINSNSFGRFAISPRSGNPCIGFPNTMDSSVGNSVNICRTFLGASIGGDYSWNVQAIDQCPGRQTGVTGNRSFRVDDQPRNLSPLRVVLTGTAGTNPSIVSSFGSTTLPTQTILRSAATLTQMDIWGQANDNDFGYSGYTEGYTGRIDVSSNIAGYGPWPLNTGLNNVTANPYNFARGIANLRPGIYRFTINDTDRCGEAAVATAQYTISIAPDSPATLNIDPADPCPVTCGARDMRIHLSWDAVPAAQLYRIQYNEIYPIPVDDSGWTDITDNYIFSGSNAGWSASNDIIWKPDVLRVNLKNVSYRVYSWANGVRSENAMTAGPVNYDCRIPYSLSIIPPTTAKCGDDICLEGEQLSSNIDVRLLCRNHAEEIAIPAIRGVTGMDMWMEASAGRAQLAWTVSPFLQTCAPVTSMVPVPPALPHQIQAGVNTYDYNCVGPLDVTITNFTAWPEIPTLTGTIPVHINPRATEEFNYSGSSISNPPPGFEKMGLPSF